MPLDITSGFSLNSLFWLTSLSPDQQGLTRRIVDDLSPFFQQIGLPFLFHSVKSAAELYKTLDVIADHARKGGRPMLHFDMHGSKKGLMVADTQEIAPWAVVPKLRKINTASQCNLCAVFGVCFALHALKEMKFSEACPVYMLIAPEEEVTFGFLEDNTVEFYRAIFSHGDVDRAYREHFSDSLKVFHCEKFLAIALTRYIKNSCKGKGAAQRRERLLTEIVLSGRARTRENLKNVRKQLKLGMRPAQELVDKYAQTFLAGRSCPFTIDDLLRLVNDSQDRG